MSEWIYIFCSSEKYVSGREIIQFVLDGVYFDEQLRFQPPPDSSELDSEQWRGVDVIYHSEKRPVSIERQSNQALLKEEIQEIFQEHEEANLPQSIVEKLNATKQAFYINYKYESLTEDAWMMMDCLEKYLAKELDGIIFVWDEGFYDQNLDMIFAYSRSGI